MKLYHGTSELALQGILDHGLAPRKVRKDRRGNWSHTVTSNSSAIYLTNAYPLHYALAACKAKEKLAILEVDTERLDPFLLAPDEDYLEQGTRKMDEFPCFGQDMKTRTRWFRQRALKDFGHYWEQSLKGLGNCCYHGVIPKEALTRVALLKQGPEIIYASDPTISLINYYVMGPYYRSLTNRLFGDKDDPQLSDWDKGMLDRHELKPEIVNLQTVSLAETPAA